MASEIPAMPGADVVAALKQWDFEVDRVEGSHHIMKHPDGRGTTVPVHKYDVPKGTLGNIMKDTGLSADQLRNAKKLARRQARELTPQEVGEGSAPAANAPRSTGGSGRGGRHGPARQQPRQKGERGPRS